MISNVFIISFSSIPFLSFLHNLQDDKLLLFCIITNITSFIFLKKLYQKKRKEKICFRPKRITEILSSSNTNSLHFTTFLIQWNWPACMHFLSQRCCQIETNIYKRLWSSEKKKPYKRLLDQKCFHDWVYGLFQMP